MEIAWNPEFLREGHAVDDTLRPDRLVLGVSSAEAEKILRQVYVDVIRDGAAVVVTDPATAELVKVAANAFLATKITFANLMGELCEAAGADVTTLAESIGLDPRIGRQFLGAGLGFGGGCLPKDLRALIARADELGVGHARRLLGVVDEVNESQRTAHRRDGGGAVRRQRRGRPDRGTRRGVQARHGRCPGLTVPRGRRPAA